jgi:hypothetical protein
MSLDDTGECEFYVVWENWDINVSILKALENLPRK